MTDEILRLQREFDEAELNADRDRLRTLLADDFRSIGEQGYVLDKEQWIARFDEFRYLSVDTADLDVSRYDRAAIVRCAKRSTAVWRGERMTLRTRMSQVWVQQSGGWRLAAVQFSSLPGD